MTDENKVTSSVWGAQVNQDSGKVPWNVLWGAGVKFAVIQACYGTREDTRFAVNCEQAKALGMPVFAVIKVPVKLDAQALPPVLAKLDEKGKVDLWVIDAEGLTNEEAGRINAIISFLRHRKNKPVVVLMGEDFPKRLPNVYVALLDCYPALPAPKTGEISEINWKGLKGLNKAQLDGGAWYLSFAFPHCVNKDLTGEITLVAFNGDADKLAALTLFTLGEPTAEERLTRLENLAREHGWKL